MVREHADDQRYSFVGPVSVKLLLVRALETGLFRIRSEVAPGAKACPTWRLSRRSRRDRCRPPRATPPSTPAYALTTASRVRRSPRTSADPRARGQGRVLRLRARHKITVIGRGIDADLQLTDQAVSRRHAEIRLATARRC